MKKEVSPGILAVAVVIALCLIGGLYYRFLGPGSRSRTADVASPYALPTSAADFSRPLPAGSGRNSITGEPLSATASRRMPPPGMAPPAALPGQGARPQ